MAFNEKSLSNLRQNRRNSPDVLPDSTSIVPIVETANPLLENQRLAQSMATAAAPGMVRVLVNTAQGKGRGVPHSVRVQAAGKVLEAAGVVGTGAQSPARSAGNDLSDMSAAELASFVEASLIALERRRLRAAAEDAEIIRS